MAFAAFAVAIVPLKRCFILEICRSQQYDKPNLKQFFGSIYKLGKYMLKHTVNLLNANYVFCKPKLSSPQLIIFIESFI